MKNTDIFKKTLRWLEPHGGWGSPHNYHNNFNVTVANNDTGLCNRILHWEVADYINEINDYEFNITVQYKQWPEMDLLDLPNTYPDYIGTSRSDWAYNYDYETLHFKTVFDTENGKVSLAKPLSEKKINSMFKKGNLLLPDNHYYSDFGYKSLEELLNINTNPNLYDHLPFYDLNNRPLSKIKLKHQALDGMLKGEMKDVVGIHIRRFNGVPVSEDEMKMWNDDTLTSLYQDISKYKTVQDIAYKFVPDERYFHIMDSILEKNPNQEFYISHDLPDMFIYPFIQKYQHRILEKRNYRFPFEDYLYKSGVDVEKIKTYGNAIDNIIDLFALSYCKMLIRVPKSTWSEFAEYYDNSLGKKPVMTVDDKIEDIVQLYLDEAATKKNKTLL